MEPIEIECISCGRKFEFTVYEQLNYSKKNFDAPKRCPDCRKHKLKAKSFMKDRHKRRVEFEWEQVMN